MAGHWGQYAGVGEETTFGTAVACTKFFKILSGSTPKLLLPRDPLPLIGERDPRTMVDRVKSGQGRLLVPMAYQGLGLLLKHAFGAVVDAGASPYTHTYTALEDAPPCTGGAGGSKPSLTIETYQALPDAALGSWFAEGCCITDLAMDIRQGQDVNLDVGYCAETVTQTAKTAAPTFSDLDTYLVKPSQITITLDGTAAPATGLSLRMNNNLDVATALLGASAITQPVPMGPREITGQVTKFWDSTTAVSKTMYDKFVSGVLAAIVATFTGPTNHSFVLTLAKVQFQGDIPETVHGGRLPMTLPFKVLYDATNTAVKLVETNTVATT